MKLTRISQLSGVERTAEINITSGQLYQWAGGAPLKMVAPQLTEDEWEFVIAGNTPDDWVTAFPFISKRGEAA